MHYIISILNFISVTYFVLDANFIHIYIEQSDNLLNSTYSTLRTALFLG
jgi:hypothetical protein